MRRRRQKLARSKPRRNEYLSPNSGKNISSVCSGTSYEGDKVTTTTPVRSQYSQRSGLQMEVCDVGWQSNSPISLTQVSRISGEDDYSEEREAALKKLVESNVPTSPPFCNEPLLGLLADHRIEPERNKSNNQPLTNEKKRNKPGRTKDDKTSARSKNLLNMLDTIINKRGGETEQNVEGKATMKELTDISVISQIGKPDNNRKVYTDSEDLYSQDIGDVNKSFDLFASTHIAKENLQLITANSDCPRTELKPLDIPQTIKKIDGSPLVLKTALARKFSGFKMSPQYTSSPLPPAIAEKKDQSYDDLWTDEEMFDDDSFVRKATQADLFATPKAQKRRTTERTPGSKTKVAKYVHNSDALSARVGTSKESLPTDHLKNQQIEDHASAKRIPFQSYVQDRSQLNSVPKGTVSYSHHQTGNDKENVTSTAAAQKSRLQCSSDADAVQQMSCASISKPHSSHPVRCTSGKLTKTLMGPQQPRLKSVAPYSFQAHPPTSNSLTINRCDTVGSNIANSMRPPTKPLNMDGNILNGVIQKNISGNISQHNSTNRLSKPGLQYKIEFQGTDHCSSSVSQKPSLLSKSSHVGSNKSYKFVSKPVSIEKPKTKLEIKKKESSSKTPPSTVTLKTVSESPNQLDTSLTADLLKTLAQPDEILDSQMARSSPGSPMPLDPEVDDDLDDMLLKAGDAFGEEERPCGMNVEMKTSVAKANDSFPSDDDALDEPQLLALLEEAETQSQILNDKSTEPLSETNKSAPCGKMSKLTLETKPDSGECIQNDHTTNVGNKNTSKAVYCAENKKSSTHFKFKDLKKEAKNLKTVQDTGIQIEGTTSAAVDQSNSNNRNFCRGQLTTPPTRSQPNHQINGSFTRMKQNVTASQKCSPEEIERKKREALVRKQNRLKLKK